MSTDIACLKSSGSNSKCKPFSNLWCKSPLRFCVFSTGYLQAKTSHNQPRNMCFTHADHIPWFRNPFWTHFLLIAWSRESRQTCIGQDQSAAKFENAATCESKRGSSCGHWRVLNEMEKLSAFFLERKFAGSKNIANLCFLCVICYSNPQCFFQSWSETHVKSWNI